MRKWLGIGMLSVLIVAAASVGAYLFFIRSGTTREAPSVDVVRVESSKNKDDGNAEPSDEIEPLIVQSKGDPDADEINDLQIRTDPPLPRFVWRTDLRLPPRPDVEPGVVKRMPMADEPIVGVWFFLNWSAIKAELSELNILNEIEKSDPAPTSENKETSPPPADLAPDYHRQHPHCPRHDTCPSPYRSWPRD
jgi:hypothetical protein